MIVKVKASLGHFQKYCIALNSPLIQINILFYISMKRCCEYGKCPKILNILFLTFFWLNFCFLCNCFFKKLSGMANSADNDQTEGEGSLIWVCTICKCHFVRKFGIYNFRTFNILILEGP